MYDLTSLIDRKKKRPEKDWENGNSNEHDCENEDEIDSGALVLYFASMLIQKGTLDADTKHLDPHMLILWDIIGHCNLDGDILKCQICDSDQVPSSSTSIQTRRSKGAITCKKCRRITHVSCTKIPAHKIGKSDFMHVCEQKEI